MFIIKGLRQFKATYGVHRFFFFFFNYYYYYYCGVLLNLNFIQQKKQTTKSVFQASLTVDGMEDVLQPQGHFLWFKDITDSVKNRPATFFSVFVDGVNAYLGVSFHKDAREFL